MAGIGAQNWPWMVIVKKKKKNNPSVMFTILLYGHLQSIIYTREDVCIYISDRHKQFMILKEMEKYFS